MFKRDSGKSEECRREVMEAHQKEIQDILQDMAEETREDWLMIYERHLEINMELVKALANKDRERAMGLLDVLVDSERAAFRYEQAALIQEAPERPKDEGRMV